MAPIARRKPGRPSAETTTANRQRILRAARESFIEFGYTTTTFEVIAARAGLSRPALHYHFANKPQLYRDAIDRPAAAVIAEAAATARNSETLTSQLVSFFSAALGADNPDQCNAQLVAAAVRESVRDAKLIVTDHSVLRAARTFISSAMREAVDRDELSSETNIADAAEAMVAVLCGIASYPTAVGPAENLPAIVSAFELLITDRLLAG
ncbi:MULTISPECIES: TetR/AcrR family transcriptional regulator [Mycobacteriaceae]|uniref:TetR/AcrR family transcriptional regulator n=1 Tax=Mycolicibacterium mucogenicum DSM 44124 TaxID=1226753 RepID=A0A8H2JG40_MYCMU|nr:MULTISPECIES: TetR/AcrR family transcriptional regulator [Mycobacteriaceae]KAB7755348.1 TetR family transcriptional regulator [Mycolicibacterium mucogenicum DSM 44124]QPG68094.1 TetR/AcrR family transcriptional regulator [Mycolicibacterium mucogenicum DSM 44124]SEB25152.1 DNA-binding transcriptional regulator, AcrR family [Mycobacterium sp. 283mftsu]